MNESSFSLDDDGFFVIIFRLKSLSRVFGREGRHPKMSTFKYDKKDMIFSLEAHGFQKVLSLKKYEDYSEDIIDMAMSGAEKFASEQLWPSFTEADEIGCTFEDGVVKVPTAYEDIFKTFCENGWYAPGLNPEYGGQGLPAVTAIQIFEFFVAANPSFMFTPGLGTSAGHLIEAFGTEKQIGTYVEKMYSGEWGGTMCLTEPGAGSAVGDLTTSATKVEGEEYYQIAGNKIFISAGDHQLSENIVHLVLARAKGDPEGIKGISLFVVPKFRADENGNIGDFNDVNVTGIEHKMGIKASPTCSLAFGDKGECRGWLIGERCHGIMYMFQMMNEARLVTGMQGVAIGNAAYQLALDYARERKQGAEATNRDPAAKSVEIINHPDVRRNLLFMKAHGEAIRGMVYKACINVDLSEHSGNEEEKKEAQYLLDLMTPICKAFASDIGFQMTERAIQIFGGYGYIGEYKVEQYMRDVKIASLYEGTNGIQALDLLGRKMRQKGGGLFMTWIKNTNALVQESTHPEMAAAFKQIDDAKNALGEAAFGFQEMSGANPQLPLLHATPFLKMFGLVEGAVVLAEQAVLAYSKLETIWEDAGVKADDKVGRRQLQETNLEAQFLESKLETTKFYAYQILPEVHSILISVKSGDTSALDIMF